MEILPKLNTSQKEAFDKSTLLPKWSSIVKSNHDIKTIQKKEPLNSNVDFFGPRVGFLFSDISYQYKTFNSVIHEKIVLSGASASIVVFLINTDTSELFTVLVKQPRIASGKFTYEFPCGMVDDSTDYEGVSIRELDEECGIHVERSELINITSLFYGEDNTIDCIPFSHPLLFDDCEYIFGVIRKMSTEEIKALEGNSGGCDEDEQITIHIVPFSDVWKISQDVVTISISEICEQLIQEGKIQLPLND